MLPVTFRFSQSSLQDYVDCPRRFQLRYIESQAWPGVQAEPFLEHERHMERGAEFHRLVQRHQLGMDESMLAAGISDPDLLAWWRAYLGFEFLHQMGGRHYPEHTLSARVGAASLIAMFDLLVVLPGERVVIFDWKTYARNLGRQWFEARLQTRVYPYVLCLSGAGLFGESVQPEQISMVYWVAGVPRDPVFFEYDAQCFERDHAYLSALVAEIAAGPSGVWALTADQGRCRFCEYRSLCGRGDVAGRYDETGELPEVDVDIDAVLGLDDVESVGF